MSIYDDLGYISSHHILTYTHPSRIILTNFTVSQHLLESSFGQLCSRLQEQEGSFLYSYVRQKSCLQRISYIWCISFVWSNVLIRHLAIIYTILIKLYIFMECMYLGHDLDKFSYTGSCFYAICSILVLIISLDYTICPQDICRISLCRSLCILESDIAIIYIIITT